MLQDPGVDALLVIVTPAGHDQSDGHRPGDLRPGRRHAEARPGRLARRRGHARGHEPPQRGRHPHLPDARAGGQGLHDPGLLRPQPRGPLRDAQGHPGRLPGRPAARSRPGSPASLTATDGRPLRSPVQGAPRGLRHPGHPARSPAADAEEAVRAAGEAGYPVVLKVLSPDITHKTDVGGVALDLDDARGGPGRLPGHAWRPSPGRRPGARLDGRHRAEDGPAPRTASR
ncbi:MAG: acetate--CoA ligase family protein [Comamonadaceae bacterium]|nr:acetate--CoA ligase family protein [Comamonadaceae bacterium]